MNEIFDFHKQLNIKKVLFVLIIVTFLIIIILEVTKNTNKSVSENKIIADNNPNSIFYDKNKSISIELSKKYELKQYDSNSNYLIELRSPDNVNIFVSQKSLINNRNLIDITSADKEVYLKEFKNYSNISDIIQTTATNNFPVCTYSFNYLQNKTRTAYYLQVIWIQTSSCYYIIDIEFPTEHLPIYSNIVSETLSAFTLETP